MTVLNWPEDFSWPYAGQPQDVPPQFARGMVRIQDQVYWLLNAIRVLNENATSESAVADDIKRGFAETLGAANTYTDESVKKFSGLLSLLEEEVHALNQRIAVTRNPVTGENSYTYVALKQMYDLLRPHTITWDELAETGYTWDELQHEGHTWYDLELFGNKLLYGSDEERIFFTPAENIDKYTPGYIADVFVTGTTWDDLANNGFIYERKGI